MRSVIRRVGASTRVIGKFLPFGYELTSTSARCSSPSTFRPRRRQRALSQPGRSGPRVLDRRSEAV